MQHCPGSWWPVRNIEMGGVVTGSRFGAGGVLTWPDCVQQWEQFCFSAKPFKRKLLRQQQMVQQAAGREYLKETVPCFITCSFLSFFYMLVLLSKNTIRKMVSPKMFCRMFLFCIDVFFPPLKNPFEICATLWKGPWEYRWKDLKMLLLTTQENNYIFGERALGG